MRVLSVTCVSCLSAVQPLEADDRPKILCEFVTQVHRVYECP